MSRVRMADLAGRHQRVAAEAERRVIEVLRSGRYVGGPVVEEAQQRIAAVMGWRYGVGVNSGTDALIYALCAMGVQPGDEVIVPAVTFFSTAGAVARIGATPVIADVRDDLPLLDPDKLPITSRTRAVIAVHLYGEPCPLPPLPVPVLDDAAQAIGADPPAKTGTMASVSFYPTKTLGAAGDGGMVFTDDPAQRDALLLLTHHGMPEPYYAIKVAGWVGANSRLDALQAAVLLAHLDDLPARVARRRAIAARYDAELPAWVRRLPRAPSHPVHQYVVRVPDRAALINTLRAADIESAIYYPRSLAAQPALQPDLRPIFATPVADRFCAEALALPVHEGLHDDEVGRVIDTIVSFVPQMTGV